MQETKEGQRELNSYTKWLADEILVPKDIEIAVGILQLKIIALARRLPSDWEDQVDTLIEADKIFVTLVALHNDGWNKANALVKDQLHDYITKELRPIEDLGDI